MSDSNQPTPDPQDTLAQLVSRALQEQPPQRAPQSLMARVQRELARRRKLHWWQRSLMHWPWPAQLAFLGASIGAALALLALGPLAGGWIERVSGSQLAHWDFTFAVRSFSLLSAVAQHGWLPPLLLAIFCLYAALFALLAAAYAMWYRPTPRVPS
ncbi:MAG TPA: hypothetical protein VME21_04360 [Steroidobacteraceae bacterium]|nr:hypothetical protein [Steroidobacteraceae bacterium]